MDLTSLDAKLYRGTAGQTAAVLMTNLRELKVGEEFAEANTTRRGDAYATGKPTRGTVQLQFQMINSDTCVDVAALRAAKNAKTPLSFRCLDKENGKGIEWDYFIQKFDEDQGDEKEQVIDVVLKPTRDYRAAPVKV